MIHQKHATLSIKSLVLELELKIGKRYMILSSLDPMQCNSNKCSFNINIVLKIQKSKVETILLLIDMQVINNFMFFSCYKLNKNTLAKITCNILIYIQLRR